MITEINNSNGDKYDIANDAWHSVKNKSKMRDFKFRSWERKQEKWCYGNQQKFFYKMEYFDFWIADCFADSETIMQFTGITDIEGKEVYESDKVIYTLNHDSSQKEIQAIVEWCNHAWRLNGIWLLTEIRNIKVVGNIYETM